MAYLNGGSRAMTIQRAPTIRLQRLDPARFDWAQLCEFDDQLIFQTREWMQFISRTQGSQPVLARVLDDGDEVGFFTGQTFKRFGLRLLGSPFPGWTTLSMGFVLRAGVSRRAALEALIAFAFGDLRCVHFELQDRWLSHAEVADLGLEVTHSVMFELDLTAEDDDMFGRMSGPCRRSIRKSAKSGVIVEQAGGEQFAAEYHEQLIDVFARKQLTPSYGVERVTELIRCLEPTGRLLLLRARGPDGNSIATGIFPAMNGTAHFWGSASWRQLMWLRPNEALVWHAMRYWRDRGMTVMELGGGGDYKRKFGPREFTVPHVRLSRTAALGHLRNAAETVLSRGHRSRS